MQTVVLTFDDACASQAKIAAPLLKKLGFGATFFICEFMPEFVRDKDGYMSWEEISELHQMGFEIGNHSLYHGALSGVNHRLDEADIEALNTKFSIFGIPRPISYAYPGGSVPDDIQTLHKCRFKYARTTVQKPWDRCDDLLHIPSYPVHGSDMSKFHQALNAAENDKLPVLLYHGIPDKYHPWVDTPTEVFIQEMEYLAANNYQVLSLRDAAEYIFDTI